MRYGGPTGLGAVKLIPVGEHRPVRVGRREVVARAVGDLPVADPPIVQQSPRGKPVLHRDPHG